MKDAFWGYAVMILGILAIIFIFFWSNVTNTDQHNYNLLKETVEASMFDALDLAKYRDSGIIQIDEEKFVENFIRRFAENASLRDRYEIEIYDISETPPKVSLKVSTQRNGGTTSITGDNITFEADVVNTIDAILETKYYEQQIIGIDESTNQSTTEDQTSSGEQLPSTGQFIQEETGKIYASCGGTGLISGGKLTWKYSNPYKQKIIDFSCWLDSNDAPVTLTESTINYNSSEITLQYSCWDVSEYTPSYEISCTVYYEFN